MTLDHCGLLGRSLPMLHINNLFFYDNVVIDKEFNGRVDGDQEGRRLAGKLRVNYLALLPCRMRLFVSAELAHEFTY